MKKTRKEGITMTSNPLLLLDNPSMATAMGKGNFRCTDLTFEEAKAIIDMHDEAEILSCISNHDIEDIIYDYLGVNKRGFPYKHIRDMRPGQDGLVFKLYVTPSETQPVIMTDKGNEAKKIQNIYVYCQLVSKID